MTLTVGLLPSRQSGGGDLKTDGGRAEADLTLLRDEPDDQFKTVAYSELPNSIRAQSENYLAMFLKPAALPQSAPGSITRVFAARSAEQDDLIEFRWNYSGHELRLVESLNAVKVQIQFAKASIPVEDAKAVVERIINTTGVDRYGKQYSIKFQWPTTLSDGTKFSSNPAADILHLNAWHDRVDATVQGRALNLLFYKKISQLIGYQDGSNWFKKYGR
jgi:hypothetical protein